MKILKIAVLLPAVITGLLSGAIIATAAITPLLSLLYYPTNNSVQMTVIGDPNAAVLLYYYNYNGSSNSVFAGNLGYTNYNGYFYGSLTNGSYNIPAGSTVYVQVDGATSSGVLWPNNSYNYSNYNYNNGYNYNNVYTDYNNYSPYYTPVLPPQYATPISFSQNNLSLAVGQTARVALYGDLNNGYYLSANSSIAGGSIDGNILTLYGNMPGTANLTVCANYYSCSTLSVSVYGNYNYNYNYYNQQYTYPQYTYPQYTNTQYYYPYNYNYPQYSTYNNAYYQYQYQYPYAYQYTGTQYYYPY